MINGSSFFVLGSSASFFVLGSSSSFFVLGSSFLVRSSARSKN